MTATVATTEATRSLTPTNHHLLERNRPMTTRHPIAALLAGAVITLSACGGSADVPASGAETPTVRSVADRHATNWQAYYDATHP